MAFVNPDLVLYQDTYREKDYSSVTELSRAFQLNADLLSPIVTHLAYSGQNYGPNNFPMLYLTEGMKNIKKVKHFEYKYPIIGRPKKSSMVVSTPYTTGDKPGVGHSFFDVVFSDRHFSNTQTLQAPGNMTARVQGDPVKVSGGWKYTLQLWEAGKATYCPLEFLQPGKTWGAGVFKVGFESSKGVESRSYLPGMMQNMTSLVRHGTKLRGNVEKKIMVYEIKAGGQTFKTYCDWEIFLANLYFNEQCEHDLWFSRYGKDDTGEMYMIDAETAIPVTSGAGIEQQIPHQDTFSQLTYKKLSQTIHDVTFNITDTKANIEIWTGSGGEMDFDLALKNDLLSSGFVQVANNALGTDGKLVSGGGYDMVYGAFFKHFRHRDGQMVTVRKHPMFDRGIKADASPIHPISGYPLTSHDMYFIDMSTYDGVSNLQYIQEEGREAISWAVPGSFVPAGFSQSNIRAHDRDESSIHGMKSQGIQINRPTSCFKLKCTIS